MAALKQNHLEAAAKKLLRVPNDYPTSSGWPWHAEC